jgi:hypothetical protein
VLCVSETVAVTKLWHEGGFTGALHQGRGRGLEEAIRLHLCAHETGYAEPGHGHGPRGVGPFLRTRGLMLHPSIPPPALSMICSQGDFVHIIYIHVAT